MERLQKVIANAGYVSRRKAEELISKGKVKVNGKIVRELGTKVTPTDIIEADGTVISQKDVKKEYYLLNKPRGVVTTTSDDKGRKTVADLIETSARIYPVGRLDYDTTGALILTNDGELANLLMHPKNNIQKLYVAKVKGLVGKAVINKLTNGVYIDGIKTSKAKARIKKYDKKTDTSIVELVIHEGRNHQVKKMIEAVGKKVIKLKRERFGIFDLSGLKASEYRRLTAKEVHVVYSMIKK